MSEEMEGKGLDTLMMGLRDVLLDGCKKHLDAQIFPEDIKEDLVLIKKSANLLYNLIKELPALSKYTDKVTRNAVEHYHLLLMDLYLTFCKRPDRILYRGQAVMAFSHLENGEVDEAIKSFEKMEELIFKNVIPEIKGDLDPFKVLNKDLNS